MLSKIPIDAISLAVIGEQGHRSIRFLSLAREFSFDAMPISVPAGTATDVTDDVHPEVAKQAVEAAAVIGLDIAGVDVVALDISQPLAAQHAAVVEVNAGPGLRMHIEPSHGKSRPVGDAIVNMITQKDTRAHSDRGVTGVNGKTTTTRLVAHIVACSGKNVGMTCTDGIYVNNRRIDTGDCSARKAPRRFS